MWTLIQTWLLETAKLKLFNPEFEQHLKYLNGLEFDQLSNLAKYANLTKEERVIKHSDHYI